MMPDNYVEFTSINLEDRCQQQCLVKLKCAQVVGKPVGRRQGKYACIVEADESMRIRMEGAPHRYQEDHIAQKGMNSLSRYNLVHTFIPMPQATKIPDAKAAVENNGEIWRKYQHGSWRKSETKMSDRRSKE